MGDEDQFARGRRSAQPLEERLHTLEHISPTLTLFDAVVRVAPQRNLRLADVGIQLSARNPEVSLAERRFFDDRQAEAFADDRRRLERARVVAGEDELSVRRLLQRRRDGFRLRASVLAERHLRRLKPAFRVPRRLAVPDQMQHKRRRSRSDSRIQKSLSYVNPRSQSTGAAMVPQQRINCGHRVSIPQIVRRSSWPAGTATCKD